MIQELITSLQLMPHPEGGFYRQIYKSPTRVWVEVGEPSPRARGEGAASAADEGRHPAVIAPHPALRATLSPLRGARDLRERAALTIIHFLLPAGQVSRWHRVDSDEVWTHLDGEPLRLHRFDGIAASNAILDRASPLQVIPAGEWQAAEPLGAYALVACFVAPGFEFADFMLMSDEAEMAAKLPEELRRFV